MLQSIKEGVIAVDNESRITIVNDEARRSQPERPGGKPAGSRQQALAMQLHLAEVLASGEPLRDRQIGFNGSELLTNTVPVIVNGQVTGAIATFRDKIEVSRLLQRLSGHGALRRCAAGAVARIYEQAACDTSACCT
ncbi:hypothetical protein M8494_14415 [Serratia ureilytica]